MQKTFDKPAVPTEYLLSDEQVVSFIIHGYHLIETDLPAAFHASVCDDIAQLDSNPGDGILDRVPKLYQVYDDPKVRGVLTSLLGADYAMNSHRHCHISPPGFKSQAWHQDGINQRHHQIRTVLAMYYPQDVPVEMGPTVIMPGTHFRNAPTDRMAAYGTLREQVLLTVKAGTVAIVHYDIWHAGTANRTDKSRYMLKFLFSRGSEIASPSWNHDPAAAAQQMSRFTFEKACTCSQSDHYKERALRQEMWNHLLGAPSAN